MGSGELPSSEPSAAPSAPPGELPALSADGPRVSLVVPEHGDAVVVVPLGARVPRPLVVALHGNYDRPEWQCDTWGRLAAGAAFVLCPRGVPRTDAPRGAERFTYTTQQATFAEVLASQQALRSRFEKYVAGAPPLLLAFSLGAIYAAREIVEHPRAYSAVALIEGGYEGWTVGRVRRFAEGGGKRVLFACAQTVCRNAARAALPLFAKQGAEARLGYAPGAGHTYGGEVAEVVAQHWEWLSGRGTQTEGTVAE